ncbi:hypothetical protein J2S43_002335 [Catenuloplanes nepalensis]|uniref:Uncharacterized protein n=1 Tax=Catenuloplanes nepalensis TaxID=587533 RepID=A0ABT9MQW9_9ACTN|nr:hypothetical protein [Catenuloplanes nepalensis]MDP9793823.1 hypothetical protein [Catenuloplanes nepalensis]
MKRFLIWVGVICALYLVVRAAIEPFVIDFSDPGTYRHDWGGPSLAGVLAAHMGPGIVSAGILVWAVLRRRRRR